MDVESDSPKPKQRRKVPRKLSPRYLENAALFHLKRYACSAKQLKTVLLRKSRRSLKVHGGDLAEATRWIDELLVKLQRNGLLDDKAFARMKADSLRASGKSARVIAIKLRLKGLDGELITEHVQRVTEDVSEEDAARLHAKKKRLGPFRIDGTQREARRMKDLAALARAGFSYAIAKKIIDGTTGDYEPVE